MAKRVAISPVGRGRRASYPSPDRQIHRLAHHLPPFVNIAK